MDCNVLKPLALGLALGLSVSATQAATLTFDDPAAPNNYDPFPQTMGDILGLDVGSTSREGFGNAALATSGGALLHWNDNYSELSDIGFASGNGRVAELSFTPASGMQVTLTSFAFGNYFNGGTARDAEFRLYDAGWNLVWSQIVTGHTGNSVTVAINKTLTGGAYFQWGTDWDIGVDNLVYDVSPIVGAVPLPPGLPLLAGALLGLGLMRRRRG
ncbi:hypothetical protein [Stagnihabitans tardus]|uniref:VPLPA-CTERM sorting domain-containing protein n=1 Tax=Stagnihabitans tardus TaxID=2699202 RepID=A0AAE5BW54_9RHOB|nr:hypothetical protein [Stagnihabitans tardus]NBZ89661.1 hypothetical protein [Stagnihabitans tardus]